MEQPITANALVTIACGLVVALYAAKRYDTPETNRVSTTRSLFLFTKAGYVVASLALFLILCEIVLKPGVLTFLGLQETQDTIAKFASPPVLAAVILTTMLPNVAVLSAGDEWILKLFQTWGRIPQGVRSLADTLTQNALPMEETDLSNLRAWITSDGDIPNELASRLSAESAETSRGSFTRVLRFYHELKKIELLPAYTPAFRRRHGAWQAIQADFQVFTAQSQAFFVLFDQLTPVEGATSQDALKQARQRYHDICQKLYGYLAEFLARLLLIVEGSEPRIESRLQTMGFCILESACPSLPFGPILFMGVVIIFAILGMVSVVQPPQSGPLPLAITAILIGITKTIGVLAAVLPKLYSSAFRPDSRGKMPYLGWLALAGLAMTVSFAIERAAFIIAGDALSAALDFDRFPLSPLAPTTFVICLAVAIMCDVDLRLGDGWVRRNIGGNAVRSRHGNQHLHLPATAQHSIPYRRPDAAVGSLRVRVFTRVHIWPGRALSLPTWSRRGTPAANRGHSRGMKGALTPIRWRNHRHLAELQDGSRLSRVK